MLKYKIGDKVVPLGGLVDAAPWFNDKYVLVKEIYGEGTDNEHYGVIPVNATEDDYSWLADKEINHEATEALNR